MSELGLPGAHDVKIHLGAKPEDDRIEIDGVVEKHCRRIRIDADMNGAPVITLELYARSIDIEGEVGEIVELPHEVEHKIGDGVVRHAGKESDIKYCHICTPRSIGSR